MCVWDIFCSHTVSPLVPIDPTVRTYISIIHEKNGTYPYLIEFSNSIGCCAVVVVMVHLLLGREGCRRYIHKGVRNIGLSLCKQEWRSVVYRAIRDGTDDVCSSNSPYREIML